MISLLAQAQAQQPQAFTTPQRIFAMALGVLMAAITIELIRRRKLREEYAMLWLVASAALLVLGAFPRLVWRLGQITGVYYLTLLVVLGFGFLALVVVHFAVVISRMAEDARNMAQRMAMLQHELELLRGKPADAADCDGQCDERR